MLNLFNLKEKYSLNKTSLQQNSIVKKKSKHFSSPLREWNNSIYVYNKNSLNLMPSISVAVLNLIKSYFALYNKKIEAKMRTKRLLLRFRRLSCNKYYISSGGFKHTNNKVVINLYVFNRQKHNYLLSIKDWYLNCLLQQNISKTNINIKLIKRLKLINKKGIETIRNLNRDKYLWIKALNSAVQNKKFNLNNFKDLKQYTENFYKKIIKKSLKRIKVYFYYKQLLYINKSKLNYTYLQYLKKYLETIYNKNVEFNLIKVKRFYLNSDILSESITLKIAKNRRKIYRYLTRLKNKIAIKKSIFTIPRNNKVKFNLSQNNLSLQSYIINKLKYRYVTGFRLEAKGRLSKRFTASRSIFKVKYKGTLSDMNSSNKGLPCVVLKGNLKSNIQYTKLKSKSRTGSFGIKGWVSGN